jgi:hypothetical protein
MVMINIIKIFLKNKVYQDFIYFKARISQTSKTFFLRMIKIFYIKLILLLILLIQYSKCHI